jgi:hypothetical protein
MGRREIKTMGNKKTRQPLAPIARYPMQMPTEAIRHSPTAVADTLLEQHERPTGRLADASANLFDAAVNRKVDGTFTDLTH